MPNPTASPKDAPPAVQNPTLYRLRVLEACPYDHVTVGGVCFSKQTEKIIQTTEGRTGRIPVAGAITPLYPEEVARVRAAMALRAIRWSKPVEVPGTNLDTGEPTSVTRRRGTMISFADSRVRKLATDVPLSDFLAIEETDDIPSML